MPLLGDEDLGLGSPFLWGMDLGFFASRMSQKSARDPVLHTLGNKPINARCNKRSDCMFYTVAISRLSAALVDAPSGTIRDNYLARHRRGFQLPVRTVRTWGLLSSSLHNLRWIKDLWYGLGSIPLQTQLTCNCL